MGCAIFPDEKNASSNITNCRGNKKTEKIDCRKRSSQALDIIVQNVTVVEENLDPTCTQFICKNLKQHPLFCTLENAQLQKIAGSMNLATAQKDQYIFKAGDSGACFFMIKQGYVQIQVNDLEIKTLGKGECFGEVALIYCTKRTASVKCISNDLQLLVIKSKLFKQVMKGIREKNNARTKTLIDTVQIFSLLTNKQKYTMLNSLVRQHYKKGTVLFNKNDIPLCFYIIESGKVSLAFDDPTKKDIVLGELQSFGQSTFKKNGRREGTATVQEDLVCLTINEDKMKECLGGTLSSIVFHNIKKWALKSSKLFHQYDNKEIDLIAMQFVSRHTKDGGIIMQADKPVNSIVICIEGKINSKPVGTIFNDQYYSIKGAKLDSDLVKNEAGVYAVLSFEKLKELLDNLNTKGSIAVARKRQSIVLKQNENVIDLNCLDYLTKLGEGQFGLVHLVKDRKSGNLFALKCLQKQKIKKQAMQESAVSERDILASLCHPLIVGYYKAYQDKKNIYFLLQYIYGVEMFDAIRQIGILNKIIARFYLGSLVLSVEYLHSRNIIYRDIKPENSIVNHQGKVFLIDMGTAKILKSDNGYRTDTIIGTPHYMAPQVMQGKGYSFEADYWSFGVIFYQLICGRLPFAEEEENPFKVYSFVMQNQVTFPTFINDQLAKNLIKKLLCKNVQTRLVGGFTELRNSQYFQGFNWDDLYQGKMVPPYVPRKFRSGTSSKYAQMQGYPLKQFLYDKKRGEKKVTQQFEVWNNNSIV